ncbi:MAG: hypothetical protein M3O30_18655 [Planctomycetota bacterium]|nr:hypothetical protein [Planctomycetota bacterium]
MRYFALLAVIATAILSVTYSVRAANSPVLKSLNVTFHTGGGRDFPGDPKKPDTHVQITMFTQDAEDIHTFAWQNDIAPDTAFDDPSNKGPYDVRVVKPISKSDFLISKTGLQIIPSGQEKWCVKVEVIATFDDGSTVKVKSKVLEMTGSNSCQAFDNQ